MSSEITSFSQFELPLPILKALELIGYETPSPIQAQSIPLLLNGADMIGQAQTGTGKTAAFALPLLSRVDTNQKEPQLLVLTPTRELAIQVAEAFQSYAKFMKDFHVLPIYGGQSFQLQLKQLKRGVQVIVGTPGRVMDHLRRETLKLDSLKAFVLDEADEMLRMGFIDDVEWILQHTPESKQTALFSATMPPPIRKIADQYLHNPSVIKIQSKTTTAETIRQRCWFVSGLHKLDALTRLLEVEPTDAVIVFVRTKTATAELADKLEARGYSCAALHGDMVQKQREMAIEKFKGGDIDIVIATDVAARGLDVDRISHVVNYDIPYDAEAYVHRIGRTGRAGRQGEAILFVSPREKRLLKAIERTTGKQMEVMPMPSNQEINQKRIVHFNTRINDALHLPEIDHYHQLIEQYLLENDADPARVAAVLAYLGQGKQPLLLPEKQEKLEREPRDEEPRSRGRSAKSDRRSDDDIEYVRYRIDVGHNHGVSPGNIVGAIANEADIDSRYIGHIKIHDDYSTVDLPPGMPKEVFNQLKKVWVCQRPLNIELMGGSTGGGAGRDKPRRKPRAQEAKRENFMPKRRKVSGKGKPKKD